MASADLTAHLLLAAGVIVVAAQVGGAVARRLDQPRVLGEITAGIVLGPSLLGVLWPAALDRLFPGEVISSLKVLADIGLVLFMFLVGLDLDLEHLRGQGHRAVAISHASIVAPMGLGALVGVWLHPRLGGDAEVLPFSLFIGAAMAVTAFPVLARILQETGLGRKPVGVMALACAAVDDVTAWCILAAVVAVAAGDGAGSVLTIVGWSTLFAAAMWLAVRPLLARWGRLPLAGALALALLAAWVTETIGIHAIFGAFLAGAVAPRNAADRLVLVDRVEPLVAGLLLPAFFMVVGLSTQIGLVDSAELWGFAAVVLAVAIVGKLGGAGLAARAMGWSWRDAATIGVLMNTRGLTEIVILTVGLERGIIGPTMFTIMVMMALATTYMAIPILHRLVPETRGSPGVRRGRRPTGSASSADGIAG